MKVCIIGAGQSGLVTCKTFLEENYEVIVLEKSKSNGLFNNIMEKEYFTWSSSRYISGFSDFPIPKNFPVWMTIREFSEYLEMYKNKFNLDKNIVYEANVIKTKEIGNIWKINYIKNKKIRSIIVDKLIICTGLNSNPKYPNLKGFTGKIVHADDIYMKMKKKKMERIINK